MDAADKCDDSVNYDCNRTPSHSPADVGSSSQQVPITEPSGTPTSRSQALMSSTRTKPPLCSSSTKRRRKLTSEVWNHFEKINIDGEDVASCHYCASILKADSKNGTTALKNHMNTCIRRKNSSIEQCFEKQKQLSINTQVDGTVQVKNFVFDQDNSRDDLACAIALHEYPLSIVSHVGFKKFVGNLQPLFKMVSRNTIKEDIHKIYCSKKSKLQQRFEKLKSRIAITTDMWTSNQKKGYMSVTAHYIDESWELQSYILRFVYVPAPHTMDVLAQEMMNVLTEWYIESKLSTITVDNCSSNDGMISILVNNLGSELLLGGKILHMRCTAHILNLVARDGLSVIENVIENVRDSVVYWSASPSRLEKFEEVARQVKVSYSKKLSLDCRTRWNSTYVMLRTAIRYKDLFPKLKLRDKGYSCVPSEEDWEKAKNIADKLEMFYDLTNLFSGTEYPTANCFFVKVCKLRIAIVTWMCSDDVTISAMAKKMFDKFEKYWKDIHIVLAVAIILDPRYKMKIVEYFFPQIYGGAANYEIEQVRKTCYDLLQEYQSRSVNLKSESSQSSLATTVDDLPEPEDAGMYAFLNASTDGYVKSELDHYLEEKVLPFSKTFDILNWWKTNKLNYPTLQMIARDFLAIPISTVASESAFSTGGRVVTDHRSRLKPFTLEALMCTQNWLRNEMKGSCITIDDSIAKCVDPDTEEDD